MARYSALAEIRNRPAPEVRQEAERRGQPSGLVWTPIFTPKTADTVPRAQRAAERRERRGAARARAMEAVELSPRAVVLLGDARLAEEIAALPLRRFVRRCLIFALVAGLRGRGRIPKALRAEAERLNHAQRLLEALQDPQPRPDPRQSSFSFMLGMPKHLRPPDLDWTLYLRPAGEFRP
jgi:hypothetical protein